MIIDNYNRIKDKIQTAAIKSGRNPNDIKIIAVTKTHPAETVQKAIDSGIRLLGENKIQEASCKIPLLTGDFTFHMIGHLQSNKSKDAVRLFDVIHSIDKISTAQKVNDEALKIGKAQKILIQVNTSGEEQKSGVSVEGLAGLVNEVMQLKNLEPLGLMTMGPASGDITSTIKCFKTVRKLLDQINDIYYTKFRELSMGMSSDYTMAVQEGATMVRIGSAIFGERNY